MLFILGIIRMRFPIAKLKPSNLATLRALPGGDAGVAMMEVVMAMALILVVAVSVTQLFMVATKMAASNRVLTAARIVVQRNLDNALSVRWDENTTPTILQTTLDTGAVYDDDGDNLNGEGTNKIALLISKTASNTSYAMIPATMIRTVQTVTNTQGATILRIKFTLTYTYQKRTQVVEMTTMRAIDDFKL